MTLSAPDEDTLAPPPPHHSRELRSRHTPSSGSSLSGRNIPTHKYSVLGSGTFGEVSKVVDLTSGELWAVKEIKEDANHDSWKKSFLEEVHILLDLRHVSKVNPRQIKTSSLTIFAGKHCTFRELPRLPDWRSLPTVFRTIQGQRTRVDYQGVPALVRRSGQGSRYPAEFLD
jgi:serine/threonine protein kinase